MHTPKLGSRDKIVVASSYRWRYQQAAMVAASALLLAACGTTTTPSTGRPVHAGPGFKGKQCEMPSPDLNPDLMRPGKPATVKARAHFVGGEVKKVEVLSGPVAYRQPVIDAMKQYKCAGNLTFVADQTFVFGVDPLSGRLGR
jgi:hypothetical protein